MSLGTHAYTYMQICVCVCVIACMREKPHAAFIYIERLQLRQQWQQERQQW